MASNPQPQGNKNAQPTDKAPQVQSPQKPQQQSSQQGLQPARRPSETAMTAQSGAGPFSMMRRLFEDLEEMMGFGPSEMPTMFSPTVDVRHDGDRVIVHADLPGLAPDDVQLRIEDGMLVIEGERKNEQESNEGGAWRLERSYGQFQRVIPLPDAVDAESAEARFENGVLEVTLKAPQRQKGKQIEIKSGAKESGSIKH